MNRNFVVKTDRCRENERRQNLDLLQQPDAGTVPNLSDRDSEGLYLVKTEVAAREMYDLLQLSQECLELKVGRLQVQ